MNMKFLLCSAPQALIVFMLTLLSACQLSVGESQMDIIRNSAEFDDYITTGLELQAAHKKFAAELHSLDSTRICKMLNYRGDIFLYIQTDTHIEEYVNNFNYSKKALQKRYPKIRRCSNQELFRSIQEHINTSDYSSKLLDASVIVQTRSTDSYTSEDDAFDFLDQQIRSSGYVEVVLISYSDGEYWTYIADGATQTHTNLNVKKVNNHWYTTSFHTGVSIVYVAHTHRYSTIPSRDDENYQTSHPGLTLYIYTTRYGLTDYSTKEIV